MTFTKTETNLLIINNFIYLFLALTALEYENDVVFFIALYISLYFGFFIMRIAIYGPAEFQNSILTPKENFIKK